MRLINAVTRQDINRALEEVHNELQRLRGRGGLSMHGDIDLQGHVVSHSGKATRDQDLVTKGTLDQVVETTSTTIINQASSSVWIYLNQDLSGTVNGVNQTFTLPYEVFDNRLAIIHQHIRLERVTGAPELREYRLTGQTIDLGLAPASGDHFKADILTPRPTSPVFDEEPSGAKNGVNVAFTLEYEPTAPSDVSVYVGGALLNLVVGTPGRDEYTLVGRTLTFGEAPLSTDPVRVDYPVKPPRDIRWGDELAGEKDGVNTVFLLDEEPYGDELALYRSHIRLKKVASPTLPTEYEITGRTVTVGMGVASTEPFYGHYAIPSGGDILHLGPGWKIGTEHGDAYATTLADHSILQPEGLNGFVGGQN